jgi:hypothetical protein
MPVLDEIANDGGGESIDRGRTVSCSGGTDRAPPACPGQFVTTTGVVALTSRPVDVTAVTLGA